MQLPPLTSGWRSSTSAPGGLATSLVSSPKALHRAVQAVPHFSREWRPAGEGVDTWSPHGKLVAVERNGGTLEIWAAQQRALLWTNEYSSRFLLAWSPDESQLAINSGDDNV